MFLGKMVSLSLSLSLSLDSHSGIIEDVILDGLVKIDQCNLAAMAVSVELFALSPRLTMSHHFFFISFSS